mmetsp:Transcript_18980/g.53909  ORF Transcript_18980/g.53909 Transcript_18980/m.53909 type:complete len:257 (+) Transcript_18980:467-1237(+)
METNGTLGGVKVVPNGEAANADAHLLPLKDHRLERIVRHVDDEMATREGVASSPPWRQLGLSVDAREPLWLTPVPQMHALNAPLVVRVAHDRSCSTQRSAFRRDGTLHVGEVGGQDCHLVVTLFHLLNDVHVPILRVRDVRVRLGCVVLSAVHAMTNVACKHRANRKLCLHLVHIDLILEATKRLAGIFIARFLRRIADGIFTSNDLIDDGNSNTMRMRCTTEDGFDGLSALEISVRCNGNEDRPILCRTFVTANK